MNSEAFRAFLAGRGMADTDVEESVRVVQMFEEYLQAGSTAEDVDSATEEDLELYIRKLYDSGRDNWENLIPIFRYGIALGIPSLSEPVFRLMDGCDVMEVLFSRTAALLGEQERDRIFRDLVLPTPGMPVSEKASYTREVLRRLGLATDEVERRTIITGVAHGLPDSFWVAEKERFEEAGDIDTYLKAKRERAIAGLEEHNREGKLFFGQEITDEVLDYVKSRPDMLSGERRGDHIYHTKIPYNTRDYLGTDDTRMKRYHACHCAWARESILSEEGEVNPVFCNCSGGFAKKPWEQALGTDLDVQLVKSALKGDAECSFIIHLPEEFIPDQG